MYDNGLTTQWQAARVAAVAASGACAAFSGCASQPQEAPKVASTHSVLTQGGHIADSVRAHPSQSLNAEPLDYRSAKTKTVPNIGWASYYSKKFQGRRTASGERYDMHALTAAHRTLPLGSYARVSNLARTRSVVVRINDRGPFVKGRMLDLSFAAAAELGMLRAGSAQVVLEPVDRPVALASTSRAPERIMLRIAPHPRHHNKHPHRH